MNDARSVLMLLLGYSMHNNSGFWLGVVQIVSLGVQNVRFQLKMGLRAPFGPVWRQYRRQTPPKVSPTSR